MSKETPVKYINGHFYDPSEFETYNVPKIVVDIAEYLNKLVPFASPSGVVETDNDWKIITKLFEAFIRCYPAEYQAFVTNVGNFRSANSATRGFTKNKDIQHQMEIPERFHQLIKLFYPLQSYNTKFTRRLAREIPVLKAV